MKRVFWVRGIRYRTRLNRPGLPESQNASRCFFKQTTKMMANLGMKFSHVRDDWYGSRRNNDDVIDVSKDPHVYTLYLWGTFARLVRHKRLPNRVRVIGCFFSDNSDWESIELLAAYYFLAKFSQRTTTTVTAVTVVAVPCKGTALYLRSVRVQMRIDQSVESPWV